MPGNFKEEIVLLGLESTRGTAPASSAWDVNFVGQGFSRQLVHGTGKVDGSATHPYTSKQVKIGSTASPSLEPDFNSNTIRDIIQMLTKRSSGVMPSFTIRHSAPSVDQMNFLGAIANQLSMEYTRGSDPDDGYILTGSLNFECMQPAATSGISAGTPATGNHFKISEASFTIDSVAADDVVSYRRQISIGLDLGGLNAAGKRIYIVEGMLQETITLRAKFSSDAWRAIVAAGDEVPVVIQHATGVANETVTETIAAATIQTHDLGNDGSTRMQEITITDPGIGEAAAPTVWTFGSAIGDIFSL